LVGELQISVKLNVYGWTFSGVGPSGHILHIFPIKETPVEHAEILPHLARFPLAKRSSDLNGTTWLTKGETKGDSDLKTKVGGSSAMMEALSIIPL
jgi:hypothetical protein